MTIKTKSGLTIELTAEQCDFVCTALDWFVNMGDCDDERINDFLYELCGLFATEYRLQIYKSNAKVFDKYERMIDEGLPF